MRKPTSNDENINNQRYPPHQKTQNPDQKTSNEQRFFVQNLQDVRKPQAPAPTIEKITAPTEKYGLLLPTDSNALREPKISSKTKEMQFKGIQLSQNENLVLYFKTVDLKTRTQEIIFEDIFQRDTVCGTINVTYTKPLPNNYKQRFEIIGTNPLICVQIDTSKSTSKLVIMDIERSETPGQYHVTFDTDRAIDLGYIDDTQLNLIGKTSNGEIWFVQYSKKCVHVYLKNRKLLQELTFDSEIASIDTLTQKDYYLLAIVTQDDHFRKGDLFIFEFNPQTKAVSPRKPIYVNFGGNYNYRTVKILNNTQIVMIGINQDQEIPSIRCISYGLSGADKGRD